MVVARVALVTWLGSLCAGVAHPQGVTTVGSVDSSGNPGNDASGSDFVNAGDRGIALSADGNVVAFSSRATNLVANDTNGKWDVFVHDRTTGITERVSVDSAGAEADDDCSYPSLSADGRIVSFESRATSLVAGDTNGMNDVFVHDRATGTTVRVDVSSAGAQANQAAQYSAVAADGATVAFASFADNLVSGDTNGWFDVFVHDLATGVTERVSVDSNGAEGDGNSADPPSLSSDGRFVAFTSVATNLVAGDTNGAVDVFVHDRATGLTERASVDSAGNQTTGRIFGGAQISGDGNVVAFQSDATNLVPNDVNGYLDVFTHDRVSGATQIMSVSTSGAQASTTSGLAAISGDGRFVAFTTSATNFAPGDKNHDSDVFVHDRAGGFTDCVSVGVTGVPSNWTSRLAALDDDGEVVVFASRSTDLVLGVLGWQVYVRERCVAPATWTNYGAGLAGSFGVPSFTSQSFPAIGSALALDLANSSGVFTAALLFVGTQRASIHSALGGDLLLLPTTTLLFVLPPVGATLTANVPRDDSLCGLVFDFQSLELDPGAAKGVSFTPGLELAIGR